MTMREPAELVYTQHIAPALEAAGIDPDMYQLTLNDKWINPNQHCTSSTCPLTHSHTARWCGSTQHRQCDCHWDYPERGQL